MSNCDIIRDLLPLYADDVCSDESRRMVDEHLEGCADCANMLKQLRTEEIEADLKEEKNEVIRYQAKRFKRRSATVGSVIAGVFMIPILVYLIVNLCTGAALDWFFIVLAALGVAASLIVVPLMVPRDRLFWTFCTFVVSQAVLLAVVFLYAHVKGFLMVESCVLFGLSAVFLPFVVRAQPLQKWLGNCNRVLVVLATDLILFANMMNMISLPGKSFFTTLRMGLFCALGIGLLVLTIRSKGGKKDE